MNYEMKIGSQEFRSMKIVYIKHIHNQLTNQVNNINELRPNLKHACSVYMQIS